MPEIIQKELSYRIMGVLFDVHSKLGNRYQEKYYQRAIAKGFKKSGLRYEQELEVNLDYDGDSIGKYFLDFLVEDKVVVEIKTVPRFRPIDFRQVLAYLRSKGLELGILANFRPDSLEYKRILNSDLIRSKN